MAKVGQKQTQAPVKSNLKKGQKVRSSQNFQAEKDLNPAFCRKNGNFVWLVWQLSLLLRPNFRTHG
jgi:hypothetical protein